MRTSIGTEGVQDIYFDTGHPNLSFFGYLGKYFTVGLDSFFVGCTRLHFVLFLILLRSLWVMIGPMNEMFASIIELNLRGSSSARYCNANSVHVCVYLNGHALIELVSLFWSSLCTC